MARWKFKTKSDLVKPFRIDVGHKWWMAHLRYLPPQQQGEFIKASTNAGKIDVDKFHTLYFEAAFVKAEGLTTDIVEMMVEMDESDDPIPTVGDNGSRTVEDREFIKCLYLRASAKDFRTQVENAVDELLKVKQAEKEAREKNFEGSSAEPIQT